jgi:hypothetical protein
MDPIQQIVLESTLALHPNDIADFIRLLTHSSSSSLSTAALRRPIISPDLEHFIRRRFDVPRLGLSLGTGVDFSFAETASAVAAPVAAPRFAARLFAALVFLATSASSACSSRPLAWCSARI